MGFIYKITNQLNNKMYIGKTTSPVADRWTGHQRKARYCDDRTEHFMLAIRKYGAENFKVETIEECPDEMLDDREIYWIDYYDTYEGYGYNSTCGGDGNTKFNRKDILEFWNQGLDSSEIAREMGCQQQTVSAALRAQGITSEEITKRGYEHLGEALGFEVEQYNELGELINTYPSVKTAAKGVNLSRDSILNACQGLVYSGDYYWKYAKDEEPILEKIKRVGTHHFTTRKRSIMQYTLDGKFIKEYNSLTEAANETGGNVAAICGACSGNTSYSNNSLWKYSDDEETTPEILVQQYLQKMNFRAKGVKVYDLNGNFINQFGSYKEAAPICNLSASSISRAISNKKPSKNYIFLPVNHTEEDLVNILNSIKKR